jgi:serine/threonine protein kinase
MAALAPPDTIGPYRIVREIGSGATARVVEAEHGGLRRRVAIKILFPRGATATGRFLREGRATARVRHPHVVDVFDVGLCEGGPYLVMELVEGGTLASRIPTPDEVDVETALAWLLPVLSAVSAAHEAGIIHRDLKPSNILVAFDPQGGLIPKVADFGISKLAEDPGELTGPEGLLGTPSYMAPEQMLDPRTVGPAADQYSIGVLLHLFLTGLLPYDAPSPLLLMNLVVAGQLPPIQGRAPWLPEGLAAVLTRALAVDPALRFPSLRALAAALLPFASARTRTLWEPEWGAAAPLPAAPWASPLSPLERSPDEAGDTLDDRAPELPARRLPSSAPGAPAPRLRRLGAALALLAALGGALGLRHQAQGSPDQQPPSFFANATWPRGKNEDALRAYRLGLVAMRGSSWEAGVEHFEEAIRLDPGLGAAHLRLAMAIASPEPQARRALAQARVLQGQLSERDQVFLRAMEVLYFASPPNHEASVARLRAGLERFPEDAELRLHLAIALQGAPTWPEAERLATRVLELEPGYPDAMQIRARARAARGDLDGALDELARCTDLAPLAVGCLRATAHLLEQTGRCAELAPMLRRWVNTDPRAFEPQLLLAGVLAREGRPWQAVEEALRQRWSRSLPADRPLRERKDRIRLALHREQFSEAITLLEALVGLPAEERDEETDDWAVDHLLFALEADRQGSAAGRIAREYLARTEARAIPVTPGGNVRLRAVAVAFHQGELPLEEARGRALAALGLPSAAPPLAPSGDRPFLRGLASLLLARTGDEAAVALRSIEESGETVPGALSPWLASAQEHAGRPADARRTLEATQRGCDGLSLPSLRGRRALARRSTRE